MTSKHSLAEKTELKPGPLSHTRLSSMQPLTDRCITDRLAGKKVVFSFCDSQFEEARKFVVDLAGFQILPADMDLMKWSALRAQLPFITADVVIIASLPPEELLRDPAGLASALKRFQQRNPRSSVVMLSLYGQMTPAGGIFSFLQSERLVDCVEQGPAQYDLLLRRGADFHELKTL